MENQYPEPKWMALSHTMCGTRDLFTRLSLLLSDSLCERPSVERDEVVKEVERRLAQIVKLNAKPIDNTTIDDYSGYANLRENVRGTFPKPCNNCGLEYQSPDDFLLGTHSVRSDVTGLKQGHNEDGSLNVALFRNCTCGSTLMAEFKCRRCKSASGIRQRDYFSEALKRIDLARTNQKKAQH
jgi:hypothetical protein